MFVCQMCKKKPVLTPGSLCEECLEYIKTEDRNEYYEELSWRHEYEEERRKR